MYRFTVSLHTHETNVRELEKESEMCRIGNIEYEEEVESV